MNRIFVYRTGDSGGARVLARYLQQNYPTARTRRVRELPPGLTLNDLVIAWGSKPPEGLPCFGLNEEAPMGDKYDQTLCLSRAGLPVPEVSSAPHPGWFARLHNHHSANDLLRGLRHGDYYVEPVRTINELRIHVFDKAVFRTGVKLPGPNAHPIFRTASAGWALSYNQEALNREVPGRAQYYKVACRAVKTLGYDFGAVDLGISPYGSACIFEVNSAPGLEGSTIESYGKQIIRWIKAERRVDATRN